MNNMVVYNLTLMKTVSFFHIHNSPDSDYEDNPL